MAAPAVDVTRIVLSKAKLYRAATGATNPLDTVVVGGDWGVSWTYLGALSAPVTWAYEYDVKEADIQDSLAGVAARKIKEKGTIETALAELRADNMIVTAAGGKKVVTAAGPTATGKDSFKIGGQGRMTLYKWAIEGEFYDEVNTTLLPIRIYVHRGYAASGVKHVFSKSDYTGTPIKIVALADLNQPIDEQLVVFDHFTIAHT